MPKSYTLATLPKPVNNNISFIEIPAKKYYVMKFSGYANEARANKKLEKFLQLLQENNITTTAAPILNQYNDPRTIPFMRTNEWWIEVSK
ncbi:heme-binding protein [Patescibacteria group bacterium]|nr:heme-binding protein [Patescibacteria group bacterium]